MTPITDYVLLAITASVFIGLFVGAVFLIRALIRGIGRVARKRNRSD
jgi:uncharacterized membrane-anchored protein YitT (DUF2179 family)